MEKSIVFPAASVPHQLQFLQLGGLRGQEMEDVVPGVDRHPDHLVEVSDVVPHHLTPVVVHQAKLVQGVSVQEWQEELHDQLSRQAV